MSALAVTPAYTALLAKVPPRVVRSEEQNSAFIAALYEMDQRRESWVPEEEELADLLTLLVEDFEERNYHIPQSSPLEALAFLMDQQGLEPKDLVDVFGAASVMSEVLHGKRELTKDQIRQLADRFAVSVEMFF